METLPYELSVQVFSYLTMADWCQAVRASRAWQLIVSSAVADRMQVVNIDVTNYTYLSPRISCFPSVDSVVLWSDHLKGNVLYQTLKQISLHNTTLSKLELITPSTMHEGRLIEALPTQTLESLTLTKVAGPFLVRMPTIIAACPKIVHFAYHVDQREYHTMPRLDFSTTITSSFSLVSLGLSTRPVRHEVMPLLRQCPLLEKLQLSVELRIDCQEVMETCPNLTHLHIGDPSILDDAIQQETTQPRCQGQGGYSQLRYFCLGDYKDAILADGRSWLASFSGTLQVLHLPDLTRYPFCSDSVEIVSCGQGGLDSYGLAVERFPSARQIRLIGGNSRIGMKMTSAPRARSDPEINIDRTVACPSNPWHDHHRPESLTLLFLDHGPAQKLTELDMAFSRLPSRILHTVARRTPFLVSLRLDTWHSNELDLTPLRAMSSLRDLTLGRIDHLSHPSLTALTGLSSLLLKQCSDVSVPGLVDLVCAAVSRLKRLVMVNCSTLAFFDPANLIQQGKTRGTQVIIRDVDVRPWSYDIPLPNRASHRYYQ